MDHRTRIQSNTLIIKWNKIVDIPSVDKYTCLNASFETNKRIAD